MELTARPILRRHVGSVNGARHIVTSPPDPSHLAGSAMPEYGSAATVRADLEEGHGAMTSAKVTDEELARLTELMAEAASALIRGDIRTYATLMRHADDFTLMPPSGGEPRRGFDGSDQALDALARYFHGGEAELDVLQSYTSGDLAVLVAIERQHGHVGALPEQEWSLRVTLVFRLDGSEWRLVHRHADPLVHAITEEQLAALARGDEPHV
jgi:ketosteroid isomerase-like protein